MHAKSAILKGIEFTVKSSEPMVVMPEKVYEELMEIIEVMSSKKLWKKVSAAEKRIKSGQFVRWEDLNRKYGL